MKMELKLHQMTKTILSNKLLTECLDHYHSVKENDYVAITNVGAYGASLSSNYNTRPLVAEILVNKNKLRYIRKKQNLLKLINS